MVLSVGPEAGVDTVSSPTSPESLSVPFPESTPPPSPDPCSFNECTAGHRWPVTLALASCPGCSGGVIAVNKTQCPVCNEPMVRSIIRSDFLPRGAGVAPRCKGIPPQGDSLDIELMRNSWQEAEKTTLTFLENEARQRTEEDKKEIAT